MRRTALVSLLAAVAGCGGGGGGGGHTVVTATTPLRTLSASDTDTIPPAKTTTQHSKFNPGVRSAASGPALSARQAREARKVRAPATFTFRSGSINPRTITVPAFIAVQLSIVSADGKPHAARLTTPRGAYRLRVAPGARASVLVAGMRAGRYPLTAGSQHATLVTGGEPGP